MQSRTAKFDVAIAQSHTIAVTVDVLYNRAPVVLGLKVASGSVTLDRTAGQRGHCSVSLAEPTLIPTPTGGVLSPYGYELQIKRGIAYYDGTTELMGLGVYPIQQSGVDGVSLVTDITGVDRSQLVADARLEDDYTITAGVAYGSAIQTLVSAGVSGLTYSFVGTPYVTPALTFTAQADRWECARGMATAIGCELFFDGNGVLVLRNEPTFGGVPVWRFVEGGLLVSGDLTLDRADAYNRVIATGENTSVGSIPRGVWTDTDTGSATNYNGGFGRKPRFYSSSYITSDQQALTAATAIGTAQKGVARSLSFAAIPNPALEPGDAITVTRTALGLNELQLIDALTFDLSATGAMTGSSRAGSVA